jgi:hypothetical protein
MPYLSDIPRDSDTVIVLPLCRIGPRNERHFDSALIAYVARALGVVEAMRLLATMDEERLLRLALIVQKSPRIR